MFHQSESKLSTVVVLVAIGFLGLLVKLQLSPSAPAQDETVFVYEMPRPKAFTQELDLSQRGINREVILAGNAKIMADLAKKNAANKAVPPKTPLAPAKKVASKLNQKSQNRGPKLSIDVVGKDAARTLSDSRISSNDSNNVNNNNYVAPVAAAAPVIEDNKKEDEKKRTVEEWKTLMATKPSKQLAYELVLAYRAGDVDSSNYYKIVSDLLKSEAQDKQEIAFYMLSSDQTSKAFELLVLVGQKLPQSLQVRVQTMLNDFAMPQKFSGLSKSLYSTQAAVVSEALRVLDLAIEMQGRTNTHSDRDVRGLASPVAEPSLFKQFLPGLAKIVESNDGAAQREAQSLTEKIQLLLQK